jgi:uncharacterized protein with NRDE domain
MCLIALFFRVVEDAPLIVGANREEFYARGGDLPRLFEGPVPAIAGLDPTAGGTWLGLNARGVLVAVTNRRKSRAPDRPRSRGLLARDLLTCESAKEAVERASRALDGGAYDGCNVVCADAASAAIIHAADWLRVRLLPPGIHVLANRDANDASDPRVMYAVNWLGSRTYGCSQQAVVALEELCAQNGADGPAICLRAGERGTVSSSIVAVRSPLATGVYLHAQGPPDVTPYADYSQLLTTLAGA